MYSTIQYGCLKISLNYMLVICCTSKNCVKAMHLLRMSCVSRMFSHNCPRLCTAHMFYVKQLGIAYIVLLKLFANLLMKTHSWPLNQNVVSIYVITSARRLCFHLALFVRLFVNKITQKLMDGF